MNLPSVQSRLCAERFTDAARVCWREACSTTDSVSHQKGAWNRVENDLTPFAGKEIPIRLEDYAYDMKNDFGQRGEVQLITK
jgi:hypothetical protein